MIKPRLELVYTTTYGVSLRDVQSTEGVPANCFIMAEKWVAALSRMPSSIGPLGFVCRMQAPITIISL
ncbi:Uncharacterized protein HZ326_2101 [Fusarium oxysporum f. sp. albedinis]|nr:Uncharacterized protein HZ326_2101 [Fusarium oxysporum f. sp. albedinis]